MDKKETKDKNKWLLPLILVLLIGSASGYYFYSRGYLDQFLNKPEVTEPTEPTVGNTPDVSIPEFIKVKPEDYFEPTLEYSQDYPEGRIILKEGEYVNLRNLVVVKSYNEKGTVSLSLIDEEVGDYRKIGTHSGIITYKDYYESEVSIPVIFETLPEELTEEEIEEIKERKGHYEEKTEIIPGFWEEVVIKKPYDERVLVREAYTEEKYIEAYDEEVLVRAGYYSRELVREAWDEPYTFCTAYGFDQVYMYICSDCGARFNTDQEAATHLHFSEGCGSYSGQNVDVGERHCLIEETRYRHHDAEYENIWHEPEYRIVHHDAETKVINHPAEYKKIHHDAEYGEPIWHPEATKTYKIWVED